MLPILPRPVGPKGDQLVRVRIRTGVPVSARGAMPEGREALTTRARPTRAARTCNILPLVPVLSEGQRERPQLAPPCVAPDSPPALLPLERPEGEPGVVAIHVRGEGEEALTPCHAAAGKRYHVLLNGGLHINHGRAVEALPRS